jgi:hypothetical protein
MKPKTDTLAEQVGKLGRPFKMVGIKKNEEAPTKFISGEFKNHWIYVYQYSDDGSLFKVELDYLGNIFKVTKQ